MTILIWLMATITQKLLNYEVRSIGNDLPAVKTFQLCKDLSSLNRKHIEMTTRAGVPLVYRFAVNAYGGLYETGTQGSEMPDDIVAPDTMMTGQDVIVIKFFGTLNNWVYRNASVKAHAAREAMFRKAGVKRSSRGSYDKTFHYALKSGVESYITPVHSVSMIGSEEFTQGEWDITRIIWESAALVDQDPEEAVVALCSTGGTYHADENVEGIGYTILSLPQLYLQSRSERVPEDSNVDESNMADYSILTRMLTRDTSDAQPEVTALAKDEQDSPPYDLEDMSADWNELVEIGRLQFSANVGHAASTVIEVPFGVCKLSAQVFNNDRAASAVSAGVDLSMRLIGIYEMEG